MFKMCLSAAQCAILLKKKNAPSQALFPCLTNLSIFILLISPTIPLYQTQAAF